jgi:hypothetical protein
MHACLSRPIGWSQPFGERITVALIPAVSGDLRRLQKRTNLSTTDLANRAITSYSFFDAQLRAGHDLIVRYRGTGETMFVRFQSPPREDNHPPPGPTLAGGTRRYEQAERPEGEKQVSINVARPHQPPFSPPASPASRGSPAGGRYRQVHRGQLGPGRPAARERRPA